MRTSVAAEEIRYIVKTQRYSGQDKNQGSAVLVFVTIGICNRSNLKMRPFLALVLVAIALLVELSLSTILPKHRARKYERYVKTLARTKRSDLEDRSVKRWSWIAPKFFIISMVYTAQQFAKMIFTMYSSTLKATFGILICQNYLNKTLRFQASLLSIQMLTVHLLETSASLPREKEVNHDTLFVNQMLILVQKSMQLLQFRL
jgi:hypothetical protein